ncbi:hypothetical protein B566_EDAN004034 [Ephemera danica]|nr:hypothetical protein B566_EDAN004034 [Ephemera danica]
MLDPQDIVVESQEQDADINYDDIEFRNWEENNMEYVRPESDDEIADVVGEANEFCFHQFRDSLANWARCAKKRIVRSKVNELLQLLRTHPEFKALPRDLRTVGFEYMGNTFDVNVGAYVCDAPARAFITQTKSHTGYNSCKQRRVLNVSLMKITMLERHLYWQFLVLD